MSDCVGIRFGRVVRFLSDAQTNFVSVVGVDMGLFGRLARMRFMVEFGVGQGEMYSLVPLYDYRYGFFVGFLWSGRKRRDEIEEIIWRHYFGRGKYPVNFHQRVLRPWSGPPMTYGSLRPDSQDPLVIDLVRQLGLPRLRLVGGSGRKHSLSAVGFVMASEQVHVILHASPVFGCVSVQDLPSVTRKVWLYGMEELALTEAELQFYVVKREGGGARVRHAKDRVMVLTEITRPLIRGRGACGTYLLLTPISRVPSMEAGRVLPLIVRGRIVESSEDTARVMEEQIIPSILVLAADISTEKVSGCLPPRNLLRVCYKTASPIDLVKKVFMAIYEKVKNTLSQHLISSDKKPFRGPEPGDAFEIGLSKCRYCMIDEANRVLIVPTVAEALNIHRAGFGSVLVGARSEDEPITHYLRAVSECEVVV